MPTYVPGTIQTNPGQENVPTHTARRGLGGWRSGFTPTEWANRAVTIPTGLREVGMVVSVENADGSYTKNVLRTWPDTWLVEPVGGGSGGGGTANVPDGVGPVHVAGGAVVT